MTPLENFNFTGNVIIEETRYAEGDAYLADTPVRVSLDIGCSDWCDAFSAPLYEQLASGAYDVCSVLPMPPGPNLWRSEHRTARKRASRAFRLGYLGMPIERHQHADSIHAINTSMTHRQGRPMSPGYHDMPTTIPDPPQECERHGVHPYGVLHGDTLVAYLWLYRSGDLALVSSILGHGDHLKNDVMYLLFETMLEYETDHGGTVVYNRADSGTAGLRYYKERVGFQAAAVDWRP